MVGCPQLGLHGPVVERAIRTESGRPQLCGEVAGDRPADDVHHECVERGRSDREHAFGVTGQQNPFDADPEADARGRGSSQHLDQSVVAPSPTDPVLCGLERVGRELERRAGVVVEPADQAVVELVTDPKRLQAFAHPVEMGPAGVAEVVGERRGVFGGLDALLALAIEDPQRIGVDALTVLGAERVSTFVEVLPQQFEVGRAAGLVAHRVEPERRGREAEGGEEAGGERDHLDVEIGVGRTEGLDSYLVVLSVAPPLGALVAERGRCIPRLPRERRPMLDERTDHGRGALGAQCEGAALSVLELVHLLADHLAALADPAAEHLDVLEGRRDGQPVTGTFHLGREEGEQRLPPRRLRPEDIVRASRGARRRRFVGHLRLSPSSPGGCGRRRRRRRDDGSG